MTKTITESAAKRQLTQLQKAIVDGLEDVKGQNIQIFDTSALSPLFERVIVASATSSRQTKALASSVRDKIREAGFPKPRSEGEKNGEWIIVDCGVTVLHIMQPAIREYYRLEEIWGVKPVKSKSAERKVAKDSKAGKAEWTVDGTRKVVKPKATKFAAKKTATKTSAKPDAKTASKTVTAKKTVAKKAAVKPADKAPVAKKVVPKKVAAKKTSTKVASTAKGSK